jgi:hypothetical protein
MRFGVKEVTLGQANPTGGMDVFLVQCLCCQVVVSATGRFLVQRSPTDCGVCLSVIK